jgi:hypothetical protein
MYQKFTHDPYINNRYETGRGMAHAVSRRPLNEETLVRSHVSPCEMCGEQSGKLTGPPPLPE